MAVVRWNLPGLPIPQEQRYGLRRDRLGLANDRLNVGSVIIEPDFDCHPVTRARSLDVVHRPAV